MVTERFVIESGHTATIERYKRNIMRTAIFLGLVYIGDAIGKPSYMVDDSTTIGFMAVVLFIFMVMDVVDFLLKHEKQI